MAEGCGKQVTCRITILCDNTVGKLGGTLGEHGFAGAPVALYGIVLLMAGVAYYVLVRFILYKHGKDSVLARAIGNDVKGKVSVGIYVLAILCAFFVPMMAMVLYALVALMWLIPDMRIERLLEKEE